MPLMGNASQRPTYGLVVRHAASRAWGVIFPHNAKQAATNGLVLVLALTASWLVVQYRWLDDPQFFISALATVAITTAAIFVTFTILFFAELLFLAPLDLIRREHSRANLAEQRCADLTGGGPIRDRTDVLSAAVYMAFKDWDHSVDDLSAEDCILLIGSHLNQIIQDAIDDQLTIWGKRERHGGNYVNLEPNFWHTTVIDLDSVLRGEPQTRSSLGRLHNVWNPLVRKSDIERLYGGE